MRQIWLSSKIFKTVVLIQFFIIVLLVVFIVTQIQSQKKNLTVYNATQVAENASKLQETSLHPSYFDDFQGKWGNGNPDGSTTWKAGDSKYAARTMPIPVIHPLNLRQTQEPLDTISRKEVLVKIDPTSENNMGVLLDETARKYGGRRANHFVGEGQYILTQRYFDVDKDGIKEEIIETMGIGGNHPPHEGFILKNNTIVLSLSLNSGGIDSTTDGNGFYVKHQVYDDQPMCCPLKYRLYRVIYENGKFVPVWEQDTTYLQFENSNTIECNDGKSSINTDRAIEIVKELPEVKSHMQRFASKQSKPIIEVDNSEEKDSQNWSVHVYENVNDGKTYHSATFNWYTIDKCTGNSKCSFSKYDNKGNLTGVSSESEYPCK